MEVPAALIAAFPPSADLLLNRARLRTDNEMLWEIGEADYGQMAEEVMAELRPIRDRGVIPSPLPWMLCEVLALTRFSDPDAPNSPPFRPGPTGRSGHQARLFACAVLLRVEVEYPQGEADQSPDSTLAQCLVSANVLGEEMSEALACFLTWRLSRPDGGPRTLLFAIGLLILATRLRSGRIEEPILGTIAEWVISQESLERCEFPSDRANPRPFPFSIQSGFWGPLAAELRTEVETIREVEVRSNLQFCANFS